MSKSRDTKIKIRRSWNINPATRIKHSRKAYKRIDSKRETEKELEEEMEIDEYEY